MNRGPTVAQSPISVDRYAGNCLIKPSSYYCGGVGAHNVAVHPEQSRCRYDAVAAVAAGGYQHSPSYRHYQQLQDWYGRTAYWHHHHQGGVGAGGPLADKANFAAHKHGMPLIQAAKYNCKTGGGGPGKKYAKKSSAEQLQNSVKKNDGGSDESSGAASENSLPRIIKPRKRRKKERKPIAVQPLQVVVASAALPDPVDDRPSPQPEEADDRSSQAQLLQQPRQSAPQPHSTLHPQSPLLQQSSLQQPLPRNVPFDAVRLSADIKAVSLEDVSTCQCACCDPVGNVWDVGRRCFSPSLTRPEPARRSWSGEPSSPPFSRTAAVELTKLDTSTAPARIRTHSLEVSSEIVTSHNGHRDIEIKFFTMPIGDHR